MTLAFNRKSQGAEDYIPAPTALEKDQAKKGWRQLREELEQAEEELERALEDGE